MPRPRNVPGQKGSAARLRAAALEVFNAVGINAASIHDICARAQVSIGSAYHHFGSKQGLADALLAEGLRDNTRALKARLDRARGPESGIRALVESLIDWVEANPEWARFIYFVAGARPRDGNDDPLHEVNAGYLTMIDDYFGPHLKSGALRPLPRDVYASLVLGPVHDYARRALNGQARGKLSRHKEFFADAAWQSVRGR